MTATWQSAWRTPKIGGVEITPETESASDTRTIAIHAPPQANKPNLQLLGVQPRRFSLRGILLGDDPAADARKLRDLHLARKATTYADAYGGDYLVFVETFGATTTRLEGGAVRVAIGMLEAESQPSPEIADDNSAAAESAGADLLQITVPLEQAANSAALAADAQEQVLRDFALPTPPPTNAIATGAARRQAQFIVRPRLNWASSAAREAAPAWNYGEKLALGVLELSRLQSGGLTIESMLRLFARFAPTALSDNAGNFTRLLWRNLNAIYRQARRAALASSVRAIVRHEPTTRQEGETVRNNLVDAIETETTREQDSAQLDYLAAARSAVIQHYDETLPTLARLVSYDTPQPMPSLVAAYRYTGDTDQAAAIAQRGGHALPLFVESPIQVAAA